MKKLIFILLCLCLTQTNALTPKNGSEPTYCEQIVALHGLLSRAQFECGFSKYNQELINDSAKCFRYELDEDYGKEVLIFGMKEFDRNVAEHGKAIVCRNLLSEFPEYIEK